MRKIFMLLAFFFGSYSVFAAEVCTLNAQTDEVICEEVRPVIRKLILKTLKEKKDLLQQERSVINAAQDCERANIAAGELRKAEIAEEISKINSDIDLARGAGAE